METLITTKTMEHKYSSVDNWLPSDAIEIYQNLEKSNWAPWLAAPISSLERQS